MTAGPGDGQAAAAAAAAAGRGHLRASHADREQLTDVLKAAFVQGRLTKDEFDARIGQTFTARTYAELASVTADLPAGLGGARSSGQAGQRPAANVLRWAACGLVTPAVLATAFVLSSLRGAGGLEAVTMLIAFGYLMFWLSAGANLLCAARVRD